MPHQIGRSNTHSLDPHCEATVETASVFSGVAWASFDRAGGFIVDSGHDLNSANLMQPDARVETLASWDDDDEEDDEFFDDDEDDDDEDLDDDEDFEDLDEDEDDEDEDEDEDDDELFDDDEDEDEGDEEDLDDDEEDLEEDLVDQVGEVSRVVYVV